MQTWSHRGPASRSSALIGGGAPMAHMGLIPTPWSWPGAGAGVSQHQRMMSVVHEEL